jgi:dienelactone hydrolase
MVPAHKVVGYTRPVKPHTTLVLFALLSSPVGSQETAPAAAEPDKFESRKVIEKVVCSKNPEQSYALYLPSHYSAARSWPIVYSFDPAGRGGFALREQVDAAEQNGYILAASNNSRNGPWKPQWEAAETMVQDTHAKLSIDDRRMYFAGFSGGARVAAMIALNCRCAAGVFLSGAGFPVGSSPPAGSTFAVFSAVGKLDFNYPEVISLQDKFAQAKYPHSLRVFEGVHEWAPTGVMNEAFAWYRVEAMKSMLQPIDHSFLEAQFSKAKERAESLEKLGEMLAAWREYNQIAATFTSFADLSAVQSKAEELGKSKVVRDAAKRERAEFEEQAQLTADISAALSSSRASESPDADAALEERVRRLRLSSETEKRPERQRIYKRALSGVFIHAMETGNDFLNEKDYPRAARAYLCATMANAKSSWAWESLGVAYALAGARKEALRALQTARTLAADTSSFSTWVNSEPAFNSIRSSPAFQTLLGPH